MIVSAVALISVVGPIMVMIAPLPLEMMMPVSLTEIIAPVTSRPHITIKANWQNEFDIQL